MGLPLMGYAQNDIPPYGDNRINQNYHIGGHVIYCIDEEGRAYNGGFTEGEIRVEYWSEEQDQNLGTRFKVTHERVEDTPITLSAPTLIKSENGFAMYLLPDGRYRLVGPGDTGQFSFEWWQCRRNFLDYVPPVAPTPTPSPNIPEGCFVEEGELYCPPFPG